MKQYNIKFSLVCNIQFQQEKLIEKLKEHNYVLEEKYTEIVDNNGRNIKQNGTRHIFTFTKIIEKNNCPNNDTILEAVNQIANGLYSDIGDIKIGAVVD